jgi:hypothetical protein
VSELQASSAFAYCPNIGRICFGTVVVDDDATPLVEIDASENRNQSPAIRKRVVANGGPTPDADILFAARKRAVCATRFCNSEESQRDKLVLVGCAVSIGGYIGFVLAAKLPARFFMIIHRMTNYSFVIARSQRFSDVALALGVGDPPTVGPLVISTASGRGDRRCRAG